MDESVRHLAELGYADPEVEAMRTQELRASQQADFGKAKNLAEQGHSNQAVALLISLLSDDPNWTRPRQLLAELYFTLGSRQDALEHLDWLTCHGIESPRLSFLSGAISLADRDLPAALDSLKYAFHVEPNIRGVGTMLGSVYIRLGHLEAAEAVLTQSLEREATDIRALDQMAVLSLRRSEFEMAADWALQALEQDMTWPLAHYRLGMSLANMGRNEEALQALETWARLEPTRATPYYWLSRIATTNLSDAKKGEEYRQRGREIIRRKRAL